MHHFKSIGEFKLELTVQKRSIRVKIGNFLSSVTLKFDRWPWKTIGHLFYAKLSFVHHFKAISEFKLAFKSPEMPNSGQNQWIFLFHVTLTFDGGPSKTIRPLFYATSSFVYHFKAMGEFKLELQKRLIWVKICDFLSRVTLKFDRWPRKTVRHLFYATSSFVHHFIAIGEFKLELQSGNSQFGSKSTIFLAVWPWNLTDDLEKQKGTSRKQHQALCIISSSYVNSNWSYGPETAKLGLDLWYWPLTSDLDLLHGHHVCHW